MNFHEILISKTCPICQAINCELTCDLGDNLIINCACCGNFAMTREFYEDYIEFLRVDLNIIKNFLQEKKKHIIPKARIRFCETVQEKVSNDKFHNFLYRDAYAWYRKNSYK